MLTDRDIIYLAGHDYALGDSRISTDHIARELAKQNRVLYVESVGLRRPRLDRNDLSRIRTKLARFSTGPRKEGPGLWVLTPLVVPVHDSTVVQYANKILLTSQIKRAAARLGFHIPLLFVFLPTMAGVVGALGESLSVYYCTDEHAAFPGVDASSVRLAEDGLLRKVTLGFATSREILANKSRLNPNIFYSPHAVDFDHFAGAHEEGPVPDDIATLAHPIVGYFGAIDRWLDLDLVGFLARARRNWSFVFIGKPVVDVSSLAELPNVVFLGPRPFQDLPAYGRAFDVATIPFRLNELTISVSPIKLKEYLAMGKAVVSTGMPAVVEFASTNPYVQVAKDPDSFLNLLEQALNEDGRELAIARQNTVRRDTWPARVAAIGEVVEASEHHSLRLQLVRKTPAGQSG